VRFIVDEKLNPGKFDVSAETVSAVIIEQLREEEQQYYGLKQPDGRAHGQQQAAASAAQGAHQEPFRRAPRAARVAAVPPIQAVPAAQIAAGGSAVVSAIASGGFGSEAAASPAAPSLYDTRSGKTYQLDHSTVVIGRDTTSGICINDINASRAHAQIKLDADGLWRLADLGSTNGTLLNDRPVDRAVLQDGDLITIGTTVLEFVEG
jgi:hypothetical protein